MRRNGERRGVVRCKPGSWRVTDHPDSACGGTGHRSARWRPRGGTAHGRPGDRGIARRTSSAPDGRGRKVSLAEHVLGVGGESGGMRGQERGRLFKATQEAKPPPGVGAETDPGVMSAFPADFSGPPIGPADGRSVDLLVPNDFAGRSAKRRRHGDHEEEARSSPQGPEGQAPAREVAEVAEPFFHQGARSLSGTGGRLDEKLIEHGRTSKRVRTKRIGSTRVPCLCGAENNVAREVLGNASSRPHKGIGHRRPLVGDAGAGGAGGAWSVCRSSAWATTGPGAR